jgi:lipopolysaccharide transport system ATP-binding protein
MGEVARGGRTVLFVSHNMEAIRALCQRGIPLKQGEVGADGEADTVVEAYFAGLSAGFGHHQRDGFAIQKVSLKNERGEETRQFCPGEDLVVGIDFDAQKYIEKPYFTVAIQGNKGYCFTANMLLDGHRPKYLEGKGSISCRFRAIPLLPQRYTVKMAIKANNGKDPIMDYEDLGSFNVIANLEDYGYKGEFQTRVSEATSVVVPYEWQLPDGTVESVALTLRAAAI